MDTTILWSLISSFTSVFILTRLLQYILKRTNIEDRKRAYVVFLIVSVFDLVGLYFYFNGITLALQGFLFYYLPFLVMWLFKDLLEVSRMKKQKEASSTDE